MRWWRSRCHADRYRAAAAPARVRTVYDETITLDLLEPVRAVAPGQSGVLYSAEGQVLGGGVIREAA